MAAPQRPRPARPTWEERYAKGRVAEETRREFWADMDSGWVMVAELVAATFTWGGIGWLLDRWLGTAPWLLSIGFLVGFAAGFYLVWARHTGRLVRPAGRSTATSEDSVHEPR